MTHKLLARAALFGTVATAGLLSVAPAHAMTTTLGGYDFGTGSGTLAPTGVVSGVSFSNFSYGPNAQPSNNFPAGENPPGKAFSAKSFADGNTIGSSDGFFAFTITPNQGYTFSLDQLLFAIKPNGNDAPKKVLVRYSTDGFSNFTQFFDNAFATKPNGKVEEKYNDFTANLGGGIFNTPVSFRFYGYNSGPGKADNLDIDNVFLKGSVTPPKPVPTPALLPGLIALGANVLRKRKAEAAAKA